MEIFIAVFLFVCAVSFLGYSVYDERKKALAYRKREELKISLLTDLCVELKYANGNLSKDDYNVYKFLRKD